MGTFVIYFTSMGAGAVLEYLYFVVHNKIVGKPIRVNHHLNIGKALSIYSLPIWGLLGVMAVGHYPAVKMFMYSALVGTFFEFATGFVLFHVFGIKIWTYKYGSLGKFTSIYSLPYWGGAGIIFLTLSKFL